MFKDPDLFALIYEDGSVFDISLYNQVSSSRNFLFKLSQDKAYFGYVEELEVLHFISSTIARKITRYHHDPFGHQTIPKSVLKAIHRDESYTNGLRIGNPMVSFIPLSMTLTERSGLCILQSPRTSFTQITHFCNIVHWPL